MSELLIRATIPTNEKPPRIIVDSNGDLPSIPYEGKGTYEGTLRRMGGLVFETSQSLAVNYVRGDLAGEHEMAYQAKPVPPDLELKKGYSRVLPSDDLKLLP